jgi:hypothetical protein
MWALGEEIKMTRAETYSWILYAVGVTSRVAPASNADISRAADGINHAVPTQKEMQSSISWLQTAGLVRKAKNKIGVTS